MIRAKYSDLSATNGQIEKMGYVLSQSEVAKLVREIASKAEAFQIVN